MGASGAPGCCFLSCWSLGWQWVLLLPEALPYCSCTCARGCCWFWRQHQPYLSCVTLGSSLSSLEKLNPDWWQPALLYKKRKERSRMLRGTTYTPHLRISGLGRGKPGAAFFCCPLSLAPGHSISSASQ